MKYEINHSLNCDIIDGKLVLYATDTDTLIIEQGKDELIKVLELFCKPMDYFEVFRLVNIEYYISENYYQELFETLRVNNILKESNEDNFQLSDYRKTKYDRQIKSFSSLKGFEYLDAIEIQKKICNSKVVIIGVGGTGSYLALSLASMGVENLVLVDFDNIELSNTSRQILYDEYDVGKSKLEVAKEKLIRYNSKLNIKTYNVHIETVEDMSFLCENDDATLLVLCADTPRGQIQYIVDEMAYKLKIPWFAYGPYHHSKIVIGPYIIPGKTSSYSEIFKRDKLTINSKTDYINSMFFAAISNPFNGFASQFASIEILKILSGSRVSSLINRRYYVDTDIWKVEYIDYGTRE